LDQLRFLNGTKAVRIMATEKFLQNWRQHINNNKNFDCAAHGIETDASPQIDDHPNPTLFMNS
jgi:hypothetical protein